MLELKELLPIVLSNPRVIPDCIESEIVDKAIADKLEKIYQLYEKTGEVISNEIANKVFDVELSDFNNADVELLYDAINEFQLARFQLAINNEDVLNWDSITKNYEKYNKIYGVEEKTTSVFTGVNDIDGLYQQFQETIIDTINTGFSDLDNAINEQKGWMRKGLYSIMGLSGYGKSIFLTNFARASFVLDQKVLYISTEMTEPEINERFFKSLTKKKSFQEALLFLKKINPQYKGLFQVIKINPYDLTVTQVQNMIQDLDYKPDVVYIDYADELLPDVRVNSEYDAQGNIYGRLKKMANELNVPIITATQTNRTAEDSEKGGTKSYVGYNAIADSVKKIRLVDGLYAIVQSVSDKQDGKIYLQMVKNRKAPTGTMIEFNIDYNTMHLSNSRFITVKENLDKVKPHKKQKKLDTSEYMTDPNDIRKILGGKG